MSTFAQQRSRTTKYGTLLDCEKGQILSLHSTAIGEIRAIAIDIRRSRDAVSLFLKHQASGSKKKWKPRNRKVTAACRTMNFGHFYPFRSRCCNALLPFQKDNSAYSAHTWTCVRFCGKENLLRHWLGRIKEGSLTYSTRPISVAGTTNMKNYSFYTRKGILIPYWPGPISEGPLTYPPRPISAKADKVARAMRVYCVTSPQGTNGSGKHPQPRHHVQHVRVYMSSSNDSPVILYFDTMSKPRGTTWHDT